MKRFGISYLIEYHPRVLSEDLPKLDHATLQRIKVIIEKKLLLKPELFGAPLRRSLKGHRKLRTGDYRIIFRLKGNMIRILIIEHRSMVYKRLLKRI